jgi:hypothetical protein
VPVPSVAEGFAVLPQPANRDSDRTAAKAAPASRIAFFISYLQVSKFNLFILMSTWSFVKPRYYWEFFNVMEVM